jgi:hypothetical protein
MTDALQRKLFCRMPGAQVVDALEIDGKQSNSGFRNQLCFLKNKLQPSSAL